METKFIFGCYWLLLAWPLYVAGLIWRTLAGRPRQFGPIDHREIRSIAVVRLDEMGDFVIFSSILRPLREAFPDARITLFLCDWVCPLAELCPYIDEVIPFPAAGPKWRQFALGPFRALRIAARFQGRFDLIINPRFDRDIRGAAFLAHFSLAPRVLGYPPSTEPFKTIVNRGYDRFYTHLLPAPGASAGPAHEIERSRGVLSFLGVPESGCTPELWLSPGDRELGRAILREKGWRPGDTLICLGIHAGYARKRWPIDHFIKLALRLMAQSDAKFLVVGSDQDRDAGELLRPALGSRLLNLEGEATLRVSAAAIGECLLYVGNDSGPKHLAAALGKPIVEICCHPEQGDAAHFQSPRRFGAIAERVILLAPRSPLAPCRGTCLASESHCIRQVSVEDAVQAVDTLLRGTVGRHAVSVAVSHE